MIKQTIMEEFNAAKRELLDLKTAQLKPSIMHLNTYSFSAGNVGAANGPRTYRIHFKQDETNEPPLIWSPRLSGMTGSGIHLLQYNSTNQTQDIRVDRLGSTTTVALTSTREITSVTYEGQLPDPVYPSAIEWTQVRDFYPADMGTTPGWCLQNSRLGFHIYSGTYMTARADMEAQQANGTLHGGTPPDYIAVPVYYANYNITTAGHVAVWDHGTVWSDGVQFPSIDSVTNSYVGWGELCDGARVVQHV